jgi:transcriptional regulator EpsA
MGSMENDILIKSRAELDLLLVNIEAAVKINRRSDFFSWVQGVFQGVLGHELLICSLAEPGTRTCRMEWMSSSPLDEHLFADLSAAGGGLIYRLIAQWERTGWHPIRLDAEQSSVEGLAAEVRRLRLGQAVAHGVVDLMGRAAGFYTFLQLTGGPLMDAAAALELMTPYLHAAWARANCDSAERPGASRAATREILTPREVEILNWVEQGKSNSEIGQILEISSLTVKNHVQKILRKLNVQNRAQAVAKGISLNLTHNMASYGRR